MTVQDWVRSELEYAEELDRDPEKPNCVYVNGRIRALREVMLKMDAE